MTTVGGTGNPYGDQAGNAPDWQNQQNLIQTAYDTSLQKLQAQREGTLQQYGFTSQGGLNDILGGKQANISFNPEYQNSIYGNAMKQHGNTLQSLREKTVMRGLGDYGLGAQDETAYQGIAAGENEGIKTNLINSLTGNLGEAQSAKTAMNQGMTDLAAQQGNYNAWAGSHNVSEGGTVADPTDFALTTGNIRQQFNALTPQFGDKIAAGATLGRIRDMIKGNGETPGLLELAGTEGYSSPQFKQLVNQYQNSLRRAGLNPNDPKWALGGGLDPTQPSKTAGSPSKSGASIINTNKPKPPKPKLPGKHK